MTRRWKDSEQSNKFYKKQAKEANRHSSDGVASAAGATEAARNYIKNAAAVTKTAEKDAAAAVKKAERDAITAAKKKERDAITAANKKKRDAIRDAKKAEKEKEKAVKQKEKAAAAATKKAEKDAAAAAKKRKNNNSTQQKGKKAKATATMMAEGGNKENDQNDFLSFDMEQFEDNVPISNPTWPAAPVKEPVSFLSLGWMHTVEFEEFFSRRNTHPFSLLCSVF